MQNADIDRLLARIGRCLEDLVTLKGARHTHQVELEGGALEEIIVKGIRPLDQLEDAAAHVLVDTWSLKDRVLRLVDEAGESADRFYEIVRTSSALQLCADIANREKHGGDPQKAWTAGNPALGRARIRIPQQALGVMHIWEGGQQVEVRDPSLVEFRVPIMNTKGAEIGEAFTVAWHALAVMQRMIRRFDAD